MSNYSAAIINDGPVAYYRFNEASGTTAVDLSGHSYNATISGSGITYSQSGAIASDSDKAFLLNGSSGKVTCPSGASPTGWNKITVEAWIKLTSNSFAQKATIWATGTTPTNTGDGIDFWIGANGVNGSFAVGIYGSHWGQATFSQTFTAGVWYHVAGTWDGSTIRLYVNGFANGSTGTISGNTIDNTGQNITIGQDPQAGSGYFPGTIDEPALYSTCLSASKVQAHYAQGIAQVAAPSVPSSFITKAPGNVLLLINDVWYPSIRQETIKIDRTANDPIPVFSFTLQDDPSHIPITELSEIVFIDAGQIGNPTHNLLKNPALNPYTSVWFHTTASGITFAQAAGGGMSATFANTAVGTGYISQSTPVGSIIPGQQYMCSGAFAGTSTPTNITCHLAALIYDNAGNFIESVVSNSITPGATPTTLTISFLAPTNASSIIFAFYYQATNATNSGTLTFTQAQFEPMCFTSGNYQLSYPTPWCASGQVNCLVLPDGTCVRQLRLFGGLITKATVDKHVGPNRQWTVTASGYAWLLGKQILNDSWTAQSDSSIIASMVTKYFPGVFSVAQVATITAQNTLAYTYNGYARDAFDTLAQSSGAIYYADAYRTIWYQPPGYNTLPFELSDRPDAIVSFPHYSYRRDTDATQLGNVIYVTGAQGIAAIVYDAQSIGTYAQKWASSSGTFWRTVNDSSIADSATAISRGQGEAGQYNYARPIVHLDTNQFMIPGYTVYLTSVTDGYFRQSFLVQKASLILSGFQSLLQATYECQCDLGAFNPDITHMTSKVMRTLVKATTAAAPQASYYGPVSAPVPVLDVMATDTINFRDSMTITVTSTASIPGIQTTWYGTAGAVYGSNLVGYG